MNKVKDIKATKVKDIKATSDNISDVEYEEINNKDTYIDSDEVQDVNPEPEFKKTVDVDEKKEKPKVVVDFMSDNVQSDFVKQNTRRATDKEKILENATSDEIKKEENTKDEASATAADMSMVADFMINIIDLAISTSLRIYAKDTSDTAYQIPVSKKQLLTRQLSVILAKYQTKFKIEFMFVITLLVVYYGPYIKAKQTRRAFKRGSKPDTKLDINIDKSQDKNTDSNTDVKIKRRKGKPSK